MEYGRPRPVMGVYAWLALLLLLPVGTLAAVGRFDGLYGQDPFAYYDYAVGPLRQSLLRLSPLPPFFWPPGYPLLVALVSFVAGPIPLAGQLVSLAAGGIVPVFTAGLAREVWRLDDRAADAWRVVPVVAGLVTALTAQLWQSSVVVMSDTTGLAAVTLGAWALARNWREGKLNWLILAGVALAWAVLTRWVYSLVLVPCALYALLLLGRRLKEGASARRFLLHGAVAALAAGVILTPPLSAALTRLLAPARATVAFGGDLEVARVWHPLNFLKRDFVTADGYQHYRLPNGLYYALAPAHRLYFTPLLAPLMLPGLWAMLRRRDKALLMLIVGWAAIVYGMLAGIPWQNFRFTLAYLPPLAILVAVGLVQVQRWLVGWAGRWSAVARGLPGLLIVGLAWMAVGGAQLTQGFIARKAAQLDIVRRVGAQMPPHARLLTFNLTSTFRHYSRIETLELYELNAADLSGLLADRRPAYLLLDVASVETQWAGHPPAENYHWLRDGPGLVRLDAFAEYTLFQVNGESDG